MSTEQIAADLFNDECALKVIRAANQSIPYRVSGTREIDLNRLVIRIHQAIDNGSLDIAKRHLNELAAILVAPFLEIGNEVYVEYGVRRDTSKVMSRLRRDLMCAAESQTNADSLTQTKISDQESSQVEGIENE